MTDSASLKRCPDPEHAGPNPLPAGEFNKSRQAKDGLQPRCRACDNRASRQHSRENPGRHRRRYWADPAKERKSRRGYRAVNLEAERERDRRAHQAAKDAVLDHYGRACACCGATENLSIDHVNGDGREHRDALFGRQDECTGMYRWLIAQGFPDGFQVLCMPCNSSKGNSPACRLDHARA